MKLETVSDISNNGDESMSRIPCDKRDKKFSVQKSIKCRDKQKVNPINLQTEADVHVVK
jgi:hypothetical protein